VLSNTILISTEECELVMKSFKDLSNSSKLLMDKTDIVQKIMKKFFKFEIEEDDMREQISNVSKIF
jgi:hypothetical protein